MDILFPDILDTQWTTITVAISTLDYTIKQIDIPLLYLHYIKDTLLILLAPLLFPKTSLSCVLVIELAHPWKLAHPCTRVFPFNQSELRWAGLVSDHAISC